MNLRQARRLGCLFMQARLFVGWRHA
jgi:hypothetical protein